MIKFKKKILTSLLAITLLTSTATNASGFRTVKVNYNNSNSQRYTATYYFKSYNNGYGNKWIQVSRPEEKPVFPVTGPSKPVVTPKPVAPKPVTPEPKPVTPKPVPAPKPVETPSVSGMSEIELEVLRLVNIERNKVGLKALTTSSEFSNVARKKSEDMAVKAYFSHTSPTYGSPFDMMKTFGITYRTAGENIALGQTSADSVMKAWMDSPGHKANILSPSFGKIGIGMYEQNGRKYWTQMFTD